LTQSLPKIRNWFLNKEIELIFAAPEEKKIEKIVICELI